MPGVCSDPNLFETTIEPLLAAGREADLCEWLKKNGLIAKEQKCPNNECPAPEKMQWHRARVVDKFNWVCQECKKKLPARHASFFADFKCELGYALKIIDGKCALYLTIGVECLKLEKCFNYRLVQEHATEQCRW